MMKIKKAALLRGQPMHPPAVYPKRRKKKFYAPKTKKSEGINQPSNIIQVMRPPTLRVTSRR